MELSSYNYHLPPELIADSPASPRDHSRLMVIDKTTGRISHHRFYDLPSLLRPSDVLVFNQTKVFPARLYGVKPTGGKVEVLLVKKLSDHLWQAISKPGLKPQQTVTFSPHLKAKVSSVNADQTLNLSFSTDLKSNIYNLISDLGHMPLPPYIHSDHSETKLRDEYQTVYAKSIGSAAAPTAGLHFTNQLLSQLRQQGIQTEFVTLHVGLGTFKPLTQNNIDTDTLHSEHFELDQTTADRLNRAKKDGRRIIAVGTTTTRVLESLAIELGRLDTENLTGETSIFIHPPYHFKFVDGMITNFHLPQTSLLMLVSAMVSKPEFIKRAYQTAIKEKYRFYSFGDATIII